MKVAVKPPSRLDNLARLDNLDGAVHAWARYRRVMRMLMVLTVTMVAGAGVAIYRQKAMVSVQLYVAMALGIGFVMLLMSALMGLLFLPRRNGHAASAAVVPDDGDEDQSAG